MRFFHETNINFVGKRLIFFIVSAFVTVFGLLSVFVLGINYGIDFEGGSEIAVRFYNNVHIDDVRNAIEKSGFRGGEIKSFGKENQYLIRIKELGNITPKLDNAFGKYLKDTKYDIIKTDRIGPKIGSELRVQAFFAVLLGVIAMLLYIGFRFEFIWGLGAIVALVHDVIFSFSLVVIIDHLGWIDLEFNQSLVAAMLTVIGYSVNDTVIVFDRIRENKDKHKGMGFSKMVNLSINETLSRTVNTVLTVVLVLLTIVIFGGPVLQGFAFTMLVGIVIGTYSSVYIASSFVIWYLQKVKKIDTDKGFEKKEYAVALKT